jgi:hypothetical protein
MHKDLVIVAAIVGGAINMLAVVPYVLDIFRRKTKPERAMWWIYSALFILLFAAQLSAGATWLLVISGAYALSAILIAVLSLRYGYGSLHRRDSVSFVIAVLGLILWLVTNKPLLAILIVIAVDFAGFWLTLTKTWHAPHSETLITWQMNCLSAIISLFTLNSWAFTIAIYPLYAVFGTALIVWLIMYRRTKITEDPGDF